MAILLGSSAKAYWSTTAFDGATVDATWLSSATVAGNIMDLTLDISSEFVDATTRAEAGQGFASQIAVLKGGQITFEMRWLPGDAMFDELIDAWVNSLTGTTFAMAALDQTYNLAATTVQGLRANWSVSLNRQEALRDIMKSSVTLSIASFPKWVKLVNP